MDVDNACGGWDRNSNRHQCKPRGRDAASVTLVVATTSASVPSISNTAAVSATEADPTPANNSDTETTTVNPLTADLAVTKTDALTR